MRGSIRYPYCPIETVRAHIECFVPRLHILGSPLECLDNWDPRPTCGDPSVDLRIEPGDEVPPSRNDSSV